MTVEVNEKLLEAAIAKLGEQLDTIDAQAQKIRRLEQYVQGLQMLLYKHGYRGQ